MNAHAKRASRRDASFGRKRGMQMLPVVCVSTERPGIDQVRTISGASPIETRYNRTSVGEVASKDRSRLEEVVLKYAEKTRRTAEIFSLCGSQPLLRVSLRNLL